MEKSHCDSVGGRNQEGVRQLEGMGHEALVMSFQRATWLIRGASFCRRPITALVICIQQPIS